MSQVIFDPAYPTEAYVADATEAILGVHIGGAVLHNVHPESHCKGRFCVIHNPSEHHMRDWPLTWRDDKGVMERRCTHGVGHPDPDDADFLISIGKEAWTIHACCGCC